MPGYATLMHVEALTAGRPAFTASSKPTASQVAGFLENTAAELDAILRGRGYTVPVASTATGAWELLESYNALGAHAYVEQSAQSSNNRDQAMAMWESAKKMLANGSIELDDPVDIAQGFPRAPSPPSPFFTRAMEF